MNFCPITISTHARDHFLLWIGNTDLHSDRLHVQDGKLVQFETVATAIGFAENNSWLETRPAEFSVPKLEDWLQKMRAPTSMVLDFWNLLMDFTESDDRWRGEFGASNNRALQYHSKLSRLSIELLGGAAHGVWSHDERSSIADVVLVGLGLLERELSRALEISRQPIFESPTK